MRTITTTIQAFTFDELSEQAKQNALDELRDQEPTSFHYDEAKKSVDEFCARFNFRTGNRSWLDLGGHSFDDDILNLSGIRLRTCLLNNFDDVLFERKYRKSYSSDTRPTFHPMRHAKQSKDGKFWVTIRSNFKTDSCCPLTGVCYDEDLLQPIREFIKKPDSRNIEDLISEGLETLRNSLEREDEYMKTDEYLIERIEANEYEFTEDGELI